MSRGWKKQSLRLKDRHGWKSRPGYAICVLDRGAVRLDYPGEWKVSADGGQVNIRDRPEPDDNCVLAVSRMHLPPELADQVPLRELLKGSMRNDERKVVET